MSSTNSKVFPFFQYGISLIVILVIEITAAGIVLGYKDKVETEVRRLMKLSLKEQYRTPDKADLFTVGWNHFMVQVFSSYFVMMILKFLN